jgi:uncharacterized protein (DUF1810 family)
MAGVTDAADPFELQRFIAAQHGCYGDALAELAAGRKQSHWMWFILPQLRALGRSTTARHYGIGSLAEARAYAAHPLLGPRLLACVKALEPWVGQRSAQAIMGPVDALKLKSCLTLFELAVPGEPLFGTVLQGFFGERDAATLALLQREP